MTGKTHRQGGMLVSIIGFALLRENGLLLPDVNVGLQWLVMYPFCYWGSTASDLDHHWDSCPSKDYPSWMINKLLHITKPIEDSMEATHNVAKKLHVGNSSTKKLNSNVIYKVSKLLNAKHRSWQTHSELFLFVMLYLLDCVMQGRFTALGAVDTAILSLVIMGVVIGVIAHLFLDCLTPDGITLVGCCIINNFLKTSKVKLRLPETFKLVPRKQFFATDGKWEHFIQWLLKLGTVLSLLYLSCCVIHPSMQFKI